MELSNSNSGKAARLFIFSGLGLLALGMAFGLVGGLQYIFPGFLKDQLSFEKARPLHVSSVLFWIILTASGAVITYLQQHTGKRIWSPVLLWMQFIIFSLTIIAIIVSYFLGKFGGREYWEFPPILAIPITIAWILFLVNFLKSVGSFKDQPVYVWMWMTGVAFFLFTYLESNLWLIPYFRNNIINDMTIQWKSYGSMVGAWNMLIYGSSIFLMDKISRDKQQGDGEVRKPYSKSGMAFALYFLGLYNLMFNWGHHIYTLPTYHWLKHISYLVSMTELLILGKIIYDWKSSLSIASKLAHHETYRYILAADGWIFLNLVLAILMSVPGINLYTHGTHITVAHAMGTTIGINSFLLLAFAHDILQGDRWLSHYSAKWKNIGYWVSNISLLTFWLSLILAGILKAEWQMSTAADRIPFTEMMLRLRPLFIVFAISGGILLLALLVVILPLLRKFSTVFKNSTSSGESTGDSPM